MKTKIGYLIIFTLGFSFPLLGQSKGKGISAKFSEKSETRVDLERKIVLEKDSKPEEIIINVKEKSLRLDLSIESSVENGRLKIEVYAPNGSKQGNFTVETLLNSSKKESAKGNIRKSLNEPQAGNWKIKIIPSAATGAVRIRSAIVE